MTTNKSFKPTWLYIKQHNVTGLKYFGKHSGINVNSYKGSGKYWTSHLSKHGNNVSTVWAQLFFNKDDLIEYAIKFSQENNIVESSEWANLKPESGIDGSGNVVQHWYNNGVENILSAVPPGKDWVKGRIHQKATTTGKVWYNNGIEHKLSSSPLGEGWVRGMLPEVVAKRKTPLGRKCTAEQCLANSIAQKKRAKKYSLTHPAHGDFYGSLSELSELYPEQKLNKVELWKLTAGKFSSGKYKGWSIKR